MINDEADVVLEELFEPFRNRYQNNLEQLVRVSEFVFDYVHLMYHKCHIVNSNCDGSYTDSLHWIKNKKQQ